MSTSCDYRSRNPTTTNAEIILPKKVAWVHAGGGGLLYAPIKSDPVKRRNNFTFGNAEITECNGDYSIMSEIPNISGQFDAKLNISQEIKELLSVDMHFNYVLFGILKILNNILEEHGNPGHVEVTLEGDEDNPEWKHADITVKLDDDTLGSEIWRKSSQEAKKFYKSIEAGKIMSSETVKRIHKFVYIIVD